MSLAVFNSATTKGEALSGINANFSALSNPINPTWKWDSADSSEPDAGCFTTDNAASGSTGLIRLSFTDASGAAGYFNIYPLLPVAAILYIGTGSGTGVAAYQITTVAIVGSAINFALANYVPCGNWLDKDYQISFAPNSANTASPLTYVAGNLVKYDTVFGCAQIVDSGIAFGDVLTVLSNLDSGKLVNPLPGISGAALTDVAKPSDITIATIVANDSIGSVFTGSGAFTNFTINNGLVTMAS